MSPINLVLTPAQKIVIILILLLSIILGTVYFTSEYKDGQYANEKLELAIKQAEELKIQTDIVRAKELHIANLQTQLENSYEKENARVNEVLLHYTGLINDGFRLRDKNRSTGVPATNATGTTGSSDQPTCGNELSAEATRFLLGFSTDADKVVNQLVTCQKYATELMKMCSAPK